MVKITAQELAKKQKKISVAEFFEKNKHILGFGNPTRALVTSVKEGVDNCLDACEEAGILPDIHVEIKNGDDDEETTLIVEDNGPGIVKREIEHIFGRLLYGSRFHQICQSRGQQGIGISAVVLYGQLSTGHHTVVKSKTSENYPARVVELAINTNKNRAEVIGSENEHWEGKQTGTRVEACIVADYIRGKRYVYEYLQNTSIVNPHACITFKEPDGTTHVFERTSDELPRRPTEIKPHPEGVELGTLIKMAKNTKTRKLNSFLKTEFSSMGSRAAESAIEEAGLEKDLKPSEMTRDQFRKLHRAFKKIKIMAPSTDCLSPISEILIKRSLRHETSEISPEFIATASRPPSVYSGNPFQVEVGLVYGGDLPKDDTVDIKRFANRVPLLYQKGGCITTKAISSIDWRRYGLDQKSGKGIPSGPAIFLVHVASTQIPFTSESKEAIADVEEIEKEVKLAFRECARKVRRHISKKKKRAKTREKFDLITQILPEIAKKSSKMLDKPVPKLDKIITEIMDVIWIEDAVQYEKVKRDKAVQTTLSDNPGEKKEGTITKSKIMVVNYKGKAQKFDLYAVVPKEAVVGDVSPEPVKISDKYIKWSLPKIQPTDKIDINFELAGLEEGDLDENDLYIEKINPSYVIGADRWEGSE
ncbi:MAG: DNA topoisomerase VI subunit B [Candidatus Thermoplasmatota archaeon]